MPDEIPRESDSQTIADTAVLAGLFGNRTDFDELASRLTATETARIEKVEAAFQEDIEKIEATRRVAQERLAVLAIEETAAKTALEKTEQEIVDLRVRLVDQEGAGRLIGASLAARRGGYSAKFMTEKVRTFSEAAAAVSEGWLQAQRKVLEYQRELYTLASERRKLNEPEFNRRAEFLREGLGQVQERLKSHEAVIDRLRVAGVTRTVSGFLLWSGYLAFGAVGWGLGEQFRRAFPDRDIQNVIGTLGRAVALAGSRLGLIGTLLLFGLGPLILLALIFGLLWSWDLALTRFDPDWKDVRKGRRTEGPLSFWLGKGPLLGRPQYSELLAKLPMVYLWSLIPIGVAALPALSGTSIGPANDPWEAIVYTYVGTVTVLGITGLMMLYLTSVIRPRLEDPAAGVMRSLRRNGELLAVVVLFVLVLCGLPAAAAWRSAVDASQTLHFLAFAALALVTGFVTAYGLVFHGLFKDLDAMRAEVRKTEELLQEFVAMPSVELFDEQTDAFRRQLNTLYRDIETLWTAPDWSLLLLGHAVPSQVRRFGMFRQNVALGPLPFSHWDVLLEPELVGKLQAHSASVEVSRGRIGALEIQRADLRRAMDDVAKKKREATAAIDELARSERERKASFHSELDQIGRMYSDLRARARTAFQVGEYLQVNG